MKIPRTTCCNPQRPYLRFAKWNRLPLIRQAEAAECGLACLAMIAGWHGLDIDLTTLRRRFPISLKGTTAKDLIAYAGALNLSCRALRAEPQEFTQLRLPCILHWEFKHFVVLSRVGRRHLVLHDPAIGERRISWRDLGESFTGVVLELQETADFHAGRERTRIAVFDLVRLTPDLVKAFTQAFLLSALLELFVVIIPFYMQLVVDEAIPSGERELLVGLSVAFALLYGFNAAAGALRSFVLQYLANVLSFEMATRLFNHLIRLPLTYFQNRQIGDVLQRFHALEPVKQIIVTGGISTVLDGILSVFTLVLMLRYSVSLAAIVLGVFCFYAVLRIITRPIARRFAAGAQVADAREQTSFLETLRAILTIKVSGGEMLRLGAWQNLYAAKLNSLIRVSNVQIWFRATAGLLNSATDVAIVYLAASNAINGLMTVGMLTAFIAYKGQFLGRMTALLDQIIEFWLLGVQLDRVADIALAERERHLLSHSDHNYELQGHLELRRVSFRYAPREREIVRNLDLEIQPGECLVINGESGGGKSTLLKLIVGLYEPTEGEVLFDGLSVEMLGLDVLRRQMGIVMQEDRLLAGSIAENIALFDARIDVARVRDCARAALVHEEIMHFPMQYHSLVGDMGTSLSSGQKQRVLIARALYRRPRILILDEGTAHLDPQREAAVREVLRTLPITRVIVAHSQSMAELGDRVLEMREGRLLTLPELGHSESLEAARMKAVS
jgi:ATP-binding cassette subfamily B protein RaxB